VSYVAYFNGEHLIPAIDQLPDGWYGVDAAMLGCFGEGARAELDAMRSRIARGELDRQDFKALGLASPARNETPQNGHRQGFDTKDAGVAATGQDGWIEADSGGESGS
jgi:hypothetical protein